MESSATVMAGSTSRPSSRNSRSRSQSRSRQGSSSSANNRYGDHDGDELGGKNPDVDGVEAGEFCNRFWGSSDEPGQEKGYEALLGRVKGASRTVDELRAFFKERSVEMTGSRNDARSWMLTAGTSRAAIEDDYARRLAKLARTSLGKEEKG